MRWGRCVRELEVVQDGDDDGRIGDEGDDPHEATTGGAEQRQHLVDASQKDGPPNTSGVGGTRRFGIERERWSWARTRWARELGGVCFGYGPADARDCGTEFGVRSQDAVVAVAMDARGRYEASEPPEKLNRREHELGTAVGCGPG